MSNNDIMVLNHDIIYDIIKLWYHTMISCTWKLKLQASWYPWYVLQNYDIIYDITENYDIITW